MNARATRRLHQGIALLGFGLANAILPQPSNALDFALSLLGYRYGAYRL